MYVPKIEPLHFQSYLSPGYNVYSLKISAKYYLDLHKPFKTEDNYHSWNLATSLVNTSCLAEIVFKERRRFRCWSFSEGCI